MEKKPETLQSYADKHCGGDRCRAMHRLLFTGGDGALDYYVREMTAEETNFVTAMVQLQDIRAFGGEANFQSVLKAEKLAASLEVSTKDIREGMENPFRKNLRKELLKLAAAVVLPAVGALVLKWLGYGYEWLFAVQAILIGLGAMNTAAAVLLFFRYRTLEKLVAQLPKPQPTNTYPTYEECRAHYTALRNHRHGQVPVATMEQAHGAMNEARKVNFIALAMILALAAVAVAAIVAATMLGIAGAIIGCAAILGLSFWQLRRVWKATLRTRDLTSGIPFDDEGKQHAEKRQNLYALAMVGLGGLYFLLTFAGCALCIGLGLN